MTDKKSTEFHVAGGKHEEGIVYGNTFEWNEPAGNTKSDVVNDEFR